MRTICFCGFVLCAMFSLMSGCTTACPDTKICLEEDGVNNGPLCQQYCEEQICNGPSDVSFAQCCEPTPEFSCPNLTDPGAFENRLECFCMCRSGGGTCDLGVDPGTGGTGGSTPTCETACGALDCVEFFDEAFEEDDWLDEVVSVTPPPGFGTHEVDQGGVPGSIAPDDGNPAPYRFVSHTIGQNSAIWVAHEKPAAEYDPGRDGAIDSIRYYIDGKSFEGSRQASHKALAKQGGLWFWTTNLVLINDNEGWVTNEWGDGDLGTPPFGSGDLNLVSGGPITFGFYTGASHTIGVTEVTRRTGVDNWRVFICKAPSSP